MCISLSGGLGAEVVVTEEPYDDEEEEEEDEEDLEEDDDDDEEEEEYNMNKTDPLSILPSPSTLQNKSVEWPGVPTVDKKTEARVAAAASSPSADFSLLLRKMGEMTSMIKEQQAELKVSLLTVAAF